MDPSRVLDSSLEFAMHNLRVQVISRRNLLSGAEDEYKQLQSELVLLEDHFKEASEKPKRDWGRRLSDVIYDVEDALDASQLAIESASRKPELLQWLTSNPSLAKQVRLVRKDKVLPILQEAQSNPDLSIPDVDSSAHKTRELRKKTRECNVVGFVEEVNTLIDCINQESDGLEVISIFGMPGLGKTTVASEIFKDQRIQNKFKIRIWVNISEDVNMNNVLLTILENFTEPNPNMTIEALTAAVKLHLEEANFFIVMDDVWTTESWNEMKAFLPMINRSGRVLVTSRQKNVAYHAHSNPLWKPHKLRFLTPQESWELLQYEVYGKLEVVDEELVQVGQVIARLCDGLPLSIIVTGGILTDKRSTLGDVSSSTSLKEEWNDVSRGIRSCLIYGDKSEHLESIISLSYAKLPHKLKKCFLYLGMFPGDACIPAKKMTLLWIAEGFVREENSKTVEETAQEYLKDLITRNLVMVEKTKLNGEAKQCSIHDVIRQFCKAQAAFEKENLFQEIVKSKQGVFEPRFEDQKKISRRFCIHSHVHDFLLKEPKLPIVRSFLCFLKGPINLQKRDIPCLTNAFNMLRVLDAEDTKFPSFPLELMRQRYLRFLALTVANDKFCSLPDTISNLQNLQTLMINTHPGATEIEADIWKMMQLRHLKSKASIILKTDGNGKGCENLQTLGRLSPKSCTDEVFDKMKNLITLGIQGDLSILLDSKSFRGLVLLSKLKLVHDLYYGVASEKPLRQLPEQNRLPPNLRVLVLVGAHLDWEQMPILGNRLSSLKVLKLKDNAFTGNSWHAIDGCFYQLEILHIERADLISWTASSDAFPKLKSLSLKNCDKLMEVPFSLGKNLEMLSMERVTKSAVYSAMKIAEEIGHRRAHGEVFKLNIAPSDKIYTGL